MATLLIISFDDPDDATAAFDKILEIHSIALLRLTGAAWISIARDGHLELRTAPHDPTTPLVAAESAAFGQILGSLLTTPVAGFAVGGTLGAVFETMESRDDTVDDDLRKRIGKALRPGKWAVAAYATEVATGEVGRQLEPFGGQLITVEINDAAQTQLAREAGIEPSAA